MGVDAKLTGVPRFDELQIVKTGLTNVSSDGSPTNWSTIAHNLGFVPIPLAFLNGVGLGAISDNGNIPLPTYLSLTVDSTNDQIIMRSWVHSFVDSENLYIVLFNSEGTVIEPFPIRYYLLRERTT